MSNGINRGAVERARLFEDVDNLIAFKKEMLARNMELVKFEMTTAKSTADVIEGCMKIMKTQDILSERMDIISERIDIVNKRLRKLETGK